MHPTLTALPLAVFLLAACDSGPGANTDNASDCPSWFRDADGDGFGNAALEQVSCEPPTGYVDNGDDCDDVRSFVNPGHVETCDLLDVDEDCDGTADDDDPTATGKVTAYADADGDGFGGIGGSPTQRCNLSDGFAATDDDCDDGDADVFPGNHELDFPLGDGIDQDCDGSDLRGVTDGFESSAMDPDVWTSLTGDAEVQPVIVYDGLYSLNMGGGGATATTVPLDTSACLALTWWYQGKRGPFPPSQTDTLRVEYWDGTVWRLSDEWAGNGAADAAFEFRLGVIPDIAAYAPGFMARLVSAGSGFDTDDFYLDEFYVGCSQDDVDNDGWPDGLDCAPNDGAHWADCGVCVDGDQDGYGPMCDLGGDCDDADNAVNPGAPDPAFDGLDTNCDGVDGVAPPLFQLEDFETGNMGPHWTLTGASNWHTQSQFVHEGNFAAENGNIGNSARSTMELDASFSVPGEVSFWRKTETESGYDFLQFYVDGVLQRSWSGFQGWQRFTFNVGAGVHTLRWRYTKDYSVSIGADSVWVDKIELTGGTILQ